MQSWSGDGQERYLHENLKKLMLFPFAVNRAKQGETKGSGFFFFGGPSWPTLLRSLPRRIQPSPRGGRCHRVKKKPDPFSSLRRLPSCRSDLNGHLPPVFCNPFALLLGRPTLVCAIIGSLSAHDKLRIEIGNLSIAFSKHIASR
jgi:hypothetical protein